MARQSSGSVICFSREFISTAFDCINSCILFVALVYIALIIFGFSTVVAVAHLYYLVGYISVALLLAAPLGIYGNSKGNYWALFSYYILSAYCLYALVMYAWLNAGDFETEIDPNSSNSSANQSSELILHRLNTGAYTIAVSLALVMCCLRIISSIKQIEPARVVVVDNNPVD